MKRLVEICWVFGLAEVSLMVVGLAWNRLPRHSHENSGATEAIIQITTIGNHEIVNWIIASLRAYELPFPHQIWVVVEPFVEEGFVGMDELICVPADFEAKAHYKARAQEYSRTVRAARGLGRHDVKIIMLDDDTLPTRKYFEDVFKADYDICEGITTPRLHYGRFLSHLDDLRTLGCLVLCSNFQGHGHPVWIHGEGLCIRGSAEQVVTWDYPIVASEDLVFGQNAVERGMTWGFVWEYIQLTSPWTWKDFITQRRRWIWGNFDAVRRGYIPPFGGFMIALRMFMGFGVGILSTLGMILVLSGVIAVDMKYTAIFYAALAGWLIEFAFAVYVGASHEDATRTQRIKNTIIGTLLAPVSSFATMVVFTIVVFKGNPKKFEVIAKVRPDKSLETAKS
jgi:hypothetical protein